MKKYDGLVVLKGGILKSYDFSDSFISNNKDLFNDFINIWDEIYENDCCVYGASRSNANNDDLKVRLCNILDKLFDLNIEIMNGFDDEFYKDKKDYRDYILAYGK